MKWPGSVYIYSAPVNMAFNKVVNVCTAVPPRVQRGQQSHCLQPQSRSLHELRAGSVDSELQPGADREEVAILKKVTETRR